MYQKIYFEYYASNILSNLLFIRSHLSQFPNSITKLEKRDSTLKYQIDVVETVKETNTI